MAVVIAVVGLLLCVWAVNQVYTLANRLFTGVVGGVNLSLRLAYASVAGFVKVSRWLWRLGKCIGVWAAQHAYVWSFVGGYFLLRKYVANELKKRS